MYSVIIPLYNKEKYIVKAIQSVLDQTYSQFELIIVNDGSTDNSLNVVQPYLNQDKRIRLINQRNSGVSTARNNGVKVSGFNFIAFLDADDWWHPDFLKSMKTLIEEFPEAGIYGSAYYTVKRGILRKTNLGIEENFKGYIDYVQAYKHSWWMPLTSISVVIPKELFYRSEGFSSKLRFGEDFDLWIRIVLL
jgi:glycosyltransferase involved in cell wall biosynthesis